MLDCQARPTFISFLKFHRSCLVLQINCLTTETAAVWFFILTPVMLHQNYVDISLLTFKITNFASEVVCPGINQLLMIKYIILVFKRCSIFFQKNIKTLNNFTSSSFVNWNNYNVSYCRLIKSVIWKLHPSATIMIDWF